MNRRGIEWSARIGAMLVTTILDKAHHLFFGNPENTQLAVTLYLCTSALFNLVAVVYYAHSLRGELSFHMQCGAFVAIVLNVASWVTYLSIHSPAITNFLGTALTYGMFFRLFWVSDGDFDAGGWRDLACRLTDRGRVIYFKEAQQ